MSDTLGIPRQCGMHSLMLILLSSAYYCAPQADQGPISRLVSAMGQDYRFSA